MMMLCSNTKFKVYSPDGDTDFFDIVTGVMQGDTVYIITISVHNLPKLRT